MTLLGIFYISYNSLTSTVQFNNFLVHFPSWATIIINQFQNISITPVRLLMSFYGLISHPTPNIPHPTQAITDLLPVSMDFPFLDISYKWDHITCGLLCLVSLTQHNVFEVHQPNYGIYQQFVPYYFSIEFHCEDIYILFIYLAVDGSAGYLQFGAVMNNIKKLGCKCLC